MEAVVQLVGVETKTGTGQRGAWTLKLYKDAGGVVYQTFDVNLQSQADGLLGNTARVVYDVEQRNGYPNNVMKAIEAAAPGLAPSSQPMQAAVQQQSAGLSTKDQQIHRQTAAKVAVHFLGFLPAEQQTRDSFYVLCRELENYFEHGQPTPVGA